MTSLELCISRRRSRRLGGLMAPSSAFVVAVVVAGVTLAGRGRCVVRGASQVPCICVRLFMWLHAAKLDPFFKCRGACPSDGALASSVVCVE
mmetsp:Transcript_37072/g.74075  ORF Transcript_37072/g.74075 Transcript_37072/m.74075 type:complete len:92 (+) Transcript_37072:1385-1660(+)